MRSPTFGHYISHALRVFSLVFFAWAIFALTMFATTPLAKAAPSTQGAMGNVVGDVVVVAVTIRPEGNARYSFDVTLRHGDTGWKHYANLWEVVTPDGKVLGTRVLVHPHVDEQPFTRSLSAVTIPASVSEVFIRARGNVHGFSPNAFRVKVPRP